MQLRIQKCFSTWQQKIMPGLQTAPLLIGCQLSKKLKKEAVIRKIKSSLSQTFTFPRFQTSGWLHLPLQKL